MGVSREEAKSVAASPALKSPPAEPASSQTDAGLAPRPRHWATCLEVALLLFGKGHVEMWPRPSP